MLLGLVTPTAGTARIDDRAFADLADPIRTVGAALEASSFHPGRSGRDHLRCWPLAGDVPTGRVDEVLELVGLADAAGAGSARTRPGMRQRLALAGRAARRPPGAGPGRADQRAGPRGHRLAARLPALPREHRADRPAVQPRARRGGADRRRRGHHRPRPAGPRVPAGRAVGRRQQRARGRAHPGRRRAAGDARAGRRRGTTAVRCSREQDGALVVLGMPAALVGRAALRAGAELHELREEGSDLERVFLDLTRDDDRRRRRRRRAPR